MEDFYYRLVSFIQLSFFSCPRIRFYKESLNGHKGPENINLNSILLKTPSFFSVCIRHLLQTCYLKIAHSRSLIRIFVVRMQKLCIRGYPKYVQRRFWSGWANAQADLNLFWAHISDVAPRFFLLYSCISHADSFRYLKAVSRRHCGLHGNVIYTHMATSIP